MIRKVVIFCLICIMSACSITPKPLTTSDRYQESIKDLKELFAQQEPTAGKLDFYEALARGLKYNLDYRIKRVNSALQAGQLDVAIYTMFPALNASGSVYNRNNEYASSGITTTGAPTDILNSTPNTVRSARVALSWNILDFGLGYVKAKQQGERYLIAQEEARKQIQQLSQDVLIAYWSAYSAQELMMEASEFESILNNAKKKLSAAMLDNTIPKQSILDYEGALLDGNRHIIQLQYKYDKAILDLKHLLNLPPGMKLTLTQPPLTLRAIHDLSKLDFRKVDALTLVNRPELRGQNYQQRIAKWGVKTVILQSLPGITLNEGWNYNSNEFLLNTRWVDRSVDLAWNLLNVASLPASFKAADTQVQYEQLKLMALTLTALTETRYAYSHYETLRNEFNVAHKQTINAEAIFKLDKDRNSAALASDQQVIIAKLHTLTARMDEDLLLSDLSTSLGELYASVGLDMLPTDLEAKPLSDITNVISKNFKQQTPWDFSSYVNYSYNKIFTDTNNTVLAKNAESENKSTVLDTVNSISQGSVGDPIGMRMLTANSKKPISRKLTPSTETQLAVDPPRPSLFGAFSKLVSHKPAPAQPAPAVNVAAKNIVPAVTDSDIKIAALKKENKLLKAQLEGEQNLEILEEEDAPQKRIVSTTKAHAKTNPVIAKKAEIVSPPSKNAVASTRIESKLSDKTFMTALFNNVNTKVKTVTPNAQPVSPEVAAAVQPKKQVVTIAKKETQKQVVAVAKKEEPNKQALVVAKKDELKKQTLTVAKKEEHKKHVVTVAKKEEPKKQTMTVAKKEEHKKQDVTVAKKEEPKKQTMTVAKKEEHKKQVVTVAKKEEPKKQTMTVAKKEEHKKQVVTVAKKEEPKKQTMTVAKKEEHKMQVVTVAKIEEPKKQTMTVAKNEEHKKQVVTVAKKGELKKQTVIVAKKEEPKKQVMTVAKKEEPKKQVVTVAKKEELKKLTVTVAKKEEPKKQVVTIAKKQEPKKQMAVVANKEEPKTQKLTVAKKFVNKQQTMVANQAELKKPVITVAKKEESKKPTLTFAKKEEFKKQIASIINSEAPKKPRVSAAKQTEPKKSVIAVAKPAAPKKQVVAAKKAEPKQQTITVANNYQPKQPTIVAAKKAQPKKPVIAAAKKADPKKQLALNASPAAHVNKKVSTPKPADQEASDDNHPTNSFVTALLTDQSPDAPTSGTMLASK